MKKTIRFAMISAGLGLLSSAAAFAEVDCLKLALSVKHTVAANSSATLQIVEKEVAANPGCACEIVKAAIEGSKAPVTLVAAIVEAAITVAPEHRHLIAQCALAVAPDALPNVQAVLAKFDPNRNRPPGHSAKGAVEVVGAKGAPVAPVPDSNPLDFPGSGIADPPVHVGGNPGGPGGLPILPWGPPIFVPPVISPPIVTPPVITPI